MTRLALISDQKVTFNHPAQMLQEQLKINFFSSRTILVTPHLKYYFSGRRNWRDSLICLLWIKTEPKVSNKPTTLSKNGSKARFQKVKIQKT